MTEPARPLDLLYSGTETELRDAVGGVLAGQASWSQVLARTESARTYDDALWQHLGAGIGVAGLLIPELLGGAGASYREAAVVAEELGRAAAPVPFLGSAVIATTALLALRAAERADVTGVAAVPGAATAAGAPSAGAAAAAPAAGARQPSPAGELLSALADGGLTAALAVPFAAGPGHQPAPSVRLDAPEPGDEPGTYRLTGTVAGVADALPAGVFLVPGDGVPFGLYEVRAGDGVQARPVVSLDQTRQLCDLVLTRAPGRQLAAGDAARRAVEAALLAGAGVLASEQLGIAERCLDMTLAYLKERRQFARPVGGFQAIKHRLADLWVLVTQARAAARAAADGLSARSGEEAGLLVALAKAACSDIALKAAQETIQLHGGIGFTWEHPAHLFLKRAKADSIGLGTADAHRASLARLADLPAPA